MALSLGLLLNQMKNGQNYYRLLHVQRDAPGEVIQSNYRTLMQQFNAHPDRGGDTSQAARINHAYAVLSNARKRAEYDRELRQQDTLAARSNERAAVSPASAVAPAAGVCPFCKNGHRHEKDIPSDAFCAICKSPLCIAKQQRLERSDQRRIARVAKQTILYYYTTWPQLRPYSGVTDNMSTHGLMFKTPQQVTVDTILKIDGTQMQSVACVVNCRQAGNVLRPDWHISVRFLTLHFWSTRGVFVCDTG